MASASFEKNDQILALVRKTRERLIQSDHDGALDNLEKIESLLVDQEGRQPVRWSDV